jgi:hypothetical protein
MNSGYIFVLRRWERYHGIVPVDEITEIVQRIVERAQSAARQLANFLAVSNMTP